VTGLPRAVVTVPAREATPAGQAMWVAMARIRLLVAEMRTGSANGDGMARTGRPLRIWRGMRWSISSLLCGVSRTQLAPRTREPCRCYLRVRSAADLNPRATARSSGAWGICGAAAFNAPDPQAGVPLALHQRPARRNGYAPNCPRSWFRRELAPLPGRGPVAVPDRICRRVAPRV
jgi:hypothetical protein